MEQNAFDGFFSLENLNLMGNHLTSFNESIILSQLKNLTRLNLKHNAIPANNLKKLRMHYTLVVLV